MDTKKGLNPCCDGRWSRTAFTGEGLRSDIFVLILVVMEDGLVPLFLSLNF